MSSNIYVSGRDPATRLKWNMEEKKPLSKQVSVFYSFYEELEKNYLGIVSLTKNLFIDLAEKNAMIIGVRNCYVCGRTNMGEQWPWESKKVDITDENITKNWTTLEQVNQKWALTTSIIGHYCFQKNCSKNQKESGIVVCEGERLFNKTQITDWGIMTNLSKRGNPFNDTLLEGYWTNGTGPWPALKGYYWICGKFAYTVLPKKWCSSCFRKY